MTALSVRGLHVRFGGNHVVQGVDLDVDAGRVTGLIGPNGAGKTTIFDVVTGLRAPAAGSVLLGDREVTRLPPHRRARLGLARTFQRLELFGSLPVRDNVVVAAEIRRSWSGDRFPPAAVADAVLARVGLEAVADEPVDALPTGLARLVEVARALATRPTVLLLDEPASGLDEIESAALADLLDGLAADGMAVLLVEHDMALVMRVCATVSVLDAGAVLACGTPAEVQADSAVVEAYLGVPTAATPRILGTRNDAATSLRGPRIHEEGR